jgi:hypothetical protein
VAWEPLLKKWVSKNIGFSGEVWGTAFDTKACFPNIWLLAVAWEPLLTQKRVSQISGY